MIRNDITLSKDHQYVATQSKDPRKKFIRERACQKLFIHQRRSIIKNGSCSSKKKYIKKYFSRLILVNKEKKKKNGKKKKSKGKEHDGGKLIE